MSVDEERVQAITVNDDTKITTSPPPPPPSPPPSPSPQPPPPLPPPPPVYFTGYRCYLINDVDVGVFLLHEI